MPRRISGARARPLPRRRSERPRTRLAVPLALSLLLAGVLPASAATTTSTTGGKAKPPPARTTAAAPSAPSRLAALTRVTYLALSYDGRTLRLYVDGVPAVDHSETGPPDAGVAETEIGAYGGRSFWDGAVDEVALYDNALSPQTVAAHYHAGVTGGSDYAKTVAGTHGVVGYWRLGSIRDIRDSVGRARGEVLGKGIVPWYGLIAKTDDKSVALDGIGTELRLTGVPVLRRTFTVEAWVLPGPRVGNRTIVARPGAWFLRTDVLGHWSGGFFHDKRIAGVAAKLAARAPRSGTRSSREASTPAPSAGGTSPIVLVLLLVLAGVAIAVVPTWRWRRKKADVGGGSQS